MNHPPTTLASDLDGTLIPDTGDERHAAALAAIRSAYAGGAFAHLVFATGRPFPSVIDAIGQFDLPQPDWIVCDVGASVYHWQGGQFLPYEPYERHLDTIVDHASRRAVEAALAGIADLTLQEPVNQTRFKVSYFAEAGKLDALESEIGRRIAAAGLPFGCIASIDPFDECALLDVLPVGVSKASALVWLSGHADFEPDDVVYAGDSGNDYEALVAGFRAIVVANATAGLVERVRAALDEKGWQQRLHYARLTNTAGVLEGARHFGLVPPEAG